MATTIEAKTGLEIDNCINCGVMFGVPITLMENRRRNGGGFYCPNGHHQGWFGTSLLDKAKQEAQCERQRADQADAARRDAVANAEIAALALARAKAEMAAQQKRTEAGMCPHCHRCFKQLRRHLKCKHGIGPKGNDK